MTKTTFIKTPDGSYGWFMDYDKRTYHRGCHRDEIDPITGLSLPAFYHINGDKEWHLDGYIHRDEIDPKTGLSLPAVEFGCGEKHWFFKKPEWSCGELHRVEIDPSTGLSLPAIECTNGYKEWRVAGQLHREDGPAIIHSDGRLEYWFFDVYMGNFNNKMIDKERLKKVIILI